MAINQTTHNRNNINASICSRDDLKALSTSKFLEEAKKHRYKFDRGPILHYKPEHQLTKSNNHQW